MKWHLTGARVLVLCAHTDDEFGCAGTVRRLLDDGARVSYVAFSRCEASVPQGLPADILEQECRRATQLLGIEPADVTILNFPVRQFPSYRQDILEAMTQLRSRVNPDLVLLPSSFDTHQDHSTVYAEGFRAFKRSTLLGYELPQNLISFSHSAFVQLSTQHLESKVRAMSAYESQAFRSYSREEFIRSLAVVRGVQAGCEFAEAFEAVRVIAN